MTNAKDANHVYQAGAVFGGLIFVEKSKRYVDLESARLTMSGAPLNYVGVFQNHLAEQVASIANELGLKAVQLHGDEDQAYVNNLRAQLNSDIEIWKAYGVTDSLPSKLEENVDRHLLDTKVGSQSGGTGKTFDWSLLSDKQQTMLAGGLSPENAKQAAQLGCIGLDFNSGVETAPGQKDLNKLQQAFAAVRDY